MATMMFPQQSKCGASTQSAAVEQLFMSALAKLAGHDPASIALPASAPADPPAALASGPPLDPPTPVEPPEPDVGAPPAPIEPPEPVEPPPPDTARPPFPPPEPVCSPMGTCFEEQASARTHASIHAVRSVRMIKTS
jgi:hypothetical protein